MKSPAKIVTGLMSLSLLIAAATAAQAQQPIHVEVDNVRVYFGDVQPQMVNGRVMVPLRGVFERLNAQVGWSDYNQTVTVNKADMDIVLRIGESHAMVNGKQVYFDAPATIERGRTLVPVRFLSETLGANVNWNASLNTVEITSAMMETVVPPRGSPSVMAFVDAGTVIPFTLDSALSSNNSKYGDRFTATIDTRGQNDYLGLPRGTKVEGWVDVATPRKGSDPGVLGVSFDNIVLNDGRRIPVFGQVIAIDDKYIQNVDGKMVARSSAKQDGNKFVWIGAGGGALLAIITKSNLITSTVIGGALGYLWDEIQKGQTRVNDVTLNTGSDFGIRLDKNLVVTR